MTVNNKAVKGKRLEGLRLEELRGGLPIFTELPRAKVFSKAQESRGHKKGPGF